MTLFFRRFFGALVLDPLAFEDVEHDRHAALQSLLIVAAVCAAAGVGSMGLGAGAMAVAAGSVLALGAWLVWAGVVVTLGTLALPERNTASNLPELLRVLGFAAAPGVFIALAALRPAAPAVLLIVSLWMMAAGVIGVRQALDYRSTARALFVCAAAWLLAMTVVAIVAGAMTGSVS
jgi:hypothetical protein